MRVEQILILRSFRPNKNLRPSQPTFERTPIVSRSRHQDFRLNKNLLNSENAFYASSAISQCEKGLAASSLTAAFLSSCLYRHQLRRLRKGHGQGCHRLPCA